MTDLRQGVTETQHAVLDVIDAHALSGKWPADFHERLLAGQRLANLAVHSPSLDRSRNFAINAAALLIDAADEIGRLIAPREVAP